MEFYDHTIDPGENVNIAAERQETVEQLTKMLAAKMSQVVETSHGP